MPSTDYTNVLPQRDELLYKEETGVSLKEKRYVS
jgi:hypothetical protein